MGRILITYATRAGATADVAGILADALREAGHDVVTADPAADPRPDGEDLFIVGSGIHATAWYPEALGWLERHAAGLEGRLALFNVCLNAADPAKRDETLGYNDVAAALAAPRASASFAGRYVPERVSLWKRVFMRTMRASLTDHVDPQAIRDWAAELDARVSA